MPIEILYGESHVHRRSPELDIRSNLRALPYLRPEAGVLELRCHRGFWGMGSGALETKSTRRNKSIGQPLWRSHRLQSKQRNSEYEKRSRSMGQDPSALVVSAQASNQCREHFTRRSCRSTSRRKVEWPRRRVPWRSYRRASCKRLERRRLTGRSTGAPTAGHQARAGGTRYIFASPGLASCRCRPVNSALGVINNHFLMSSAETLTLLIAGAAGVATALATLAAFRSARSAEAAQAALIDSDHREVRKQVAELVAEIERDHRRARFLAHTLRVVDRANAVLSGSYGGSRGKLLEKGPEDRLQEAEALAKASKEMLEQPHTIASLTMEDAERLRLDRTIDLARLRSINDEFTRDSQSRESQLLQNREATLSRPPR
jgi:hypothetical protein